MEQDVRMLMDEKVGFVQPGEENTLGRPYSSIENVCEGI